MKELHPYSPEERRKRLARLRARFGKAAIERAKREIKPLIVAKRVAVGIYDDGFIHAGNLAYLALLALFPFMILAAAVARFFGLTRGFVQVFERGRVFWHRHSFRRFEEMLDGFRGFALLGINPAQTGIGGMIARLTPATC